MNLNGHWSESRFCAVRPTLTDQGPVAGDRSSPSTDCSARGGNLLGDCAEQQLSRLDLD
jgi:hypothetical protein